MKPRCLSSVRAIVLDTALRRFRTMPSLIMALAFLVASYGCGGGGGASGASAPLPPPPPPPLPRCDAKGDVFVSSPLGIGPSGVTSGVAHLDRTGNPLPSFAIGLGPAGLAIGSDGNLYVAAKSLLLAPIVARYDRAGNFIDCFFPKVQNCRGLGPVLQTAFNDLTFGPDGNLYVASTNGVYRFDGTTGRPLETDLLGLPAPFFPGAFGGYGFITFSTDKTDPNLYMVTSIAPSIWRVSTVTKQLIPLVLKFTHVDLGSGIRVGPDRKLYVTNNTNVSTPSGGTAVLAQVDRYDLNGNFETTFIAQKNPPLGSASNLAFGNDGNLYVLGFSGNNIPCYDGTNGTFLDIFATVPANVGSSPVYIAFSPR